MTMIGDLALRTTGGALLLSAWEEGRILRHMVHLHGAAQASIGQIALAALIFLSTSFGLALLILGRHIGDQVAVSDRWARRLDDRPERRR